MLGFNYVNKFLKEPISIRLGNHLLGITLPGKSETVFFRKNIRDIIAASDSHDAASVLLDLHGEKTWKINLPDDDSIEITAQQFRKDGFHPLADFIVKSKRSLMAAEIDLISYWKEFFEKALLNEAKTIGLFETEVQQKAVSLAISKHRPSRYKTTTCPKAVNFINNDWPDLYAEIRRHLT